MTCNAVTCLKPSPGGLHLGHFVGNVEPLIRHQDDMKCFFMFVDMQLAQNKTDALRGEKLLDSMIDMMSQMIQMGVNPEKVTFGIESEVKQNRICDLILLSNFITRERVLRIPPLKNRKVIPLNEIVFPAMEALDFTTTNSSIGFSNRDNKPIFELINEIFAKVNKIYSTELPHIELSHGRVDGLLGPNQKKMSKANNNCIFLSDTEATIKEKVNKMHTDSGRISSTSPGSIEKNVVFNHLQAYCDKSLYSQLSEQYTKGTISDRETKDILSEQIVTFLNEVNKKKPPSRSSLKALLITGSKKITEMNYNPLHLNRVEYTF
jgi:tryptophanyl-tRNA synthetase